MERFEAVAGGKRDLHVRYQRAEFVALFDLVRFLLLLLQLAYAAAADLASAAHDLDLAAFFDGARLHLAADDLLVLGRAEDRQDLCLA